MGCMHSSSRIKEDRPGTDTEGIPVKADGEVHPEIIQLAEVHYLVSFVFLQTEGKRSLALMSCSLLSLLKKKCMLSLMEIRWGGYTRSARSSPLEVQLNFNC